MRSGYKPTGGALLPAPEPKEAKAFGYAAQDPFIAYPGGGTAMDTGAMPTTRVGLWNARHRMWRDGFETGIGPKVREYWKLYRAFDYAPMGGPGQEWRDRTVIPQVFKIIETRVPRIVLAMFGQRNWFSCQGRGYRDEQYEEMVRVLMEQSFDEVGLRDHEDGGYLKRVIDGLRYGQIMGHVWWKVFWRREPKKVSTRAPILGEDGKVLKWVPVEFEEMLYDNLDFTWIPLSQLACDLSGANRWKIEIQQSSWQKLEADDKAYFEKTGIHLYKNLNLRPRPTPGGSGVVSDSFDEPRDTENWPLGEEQYYGDPAEDPVELWLCWDNVHQTLTKVVNRSIEIAHGLSPTPDGIDPIISHPAVPVPGRIYGESITHYIGPLAQLQTRIARARMDEVMLNVWQQFVFRAGTVRSSQLLFKPGGAVIIDDADPTRPVTDSVGILPRKPVMPEVMGEEGYRQAQAEAVAGADSVSQGVEATQKSRDVSATEVQSRQVQGGVKYQLENLYHEAVFKRPLLQKSFDLLRQNLTQAKMVAVLGEEKQIDLRDLNRPVDIVVGGGLREASRDEEAKQIQDLIALGDSPKWGIWIKERPTLLEKFENQGRRDANDFVRTEEEVQQMVQAAAAAEAAQAGGQGAQAPPAQKGGGPGGKPSGASKDSSRTPQAGGPPPGGGQAGMSGRRALAGPRGEEPEAPPSGPRGTVEIL